MKKNRKIEAKSIGQVLGETWVELLQFFSNTSPDFELFSLKKLHQAYANDTPNFEPFNLRQPFDEIRMKAGQNRYGKMASLSLIFSDISFMCCVGQKLL